MAGGCRSLRLPSASLNRLFTLRKPNVQPEDTTRTGLARILDSMGAERVHDLVRRRQRSELPGRAITCFGRGAPGAATQCASSDENRYFVRNFNHAYAI